MDAVSRLASNLNLTSGEQANQSSECEFCFGAGREIVPYYCDLETRALAGGARLCRCRIPKIVEAASAQIPARYQTATLSTLAPRDSGQMKIVAFLRANPGRNFYLWGKADTGKTHFLFALYRAALERGTQAWAFKLKELLDSYYQRIRAEREGQFYKLLLDTGEVRAKGPRLFIGIDDVDKVRPTDYVAEQFFDLLDAAYSNRHQLVVTSQLNPDELVAHYEEAHPRYGYAMVRRIWNDETVTWPRYEGK